MTLFSQYEELSPGTSYKMDETLNEFAKVKPDRKGQMLCNQFNLNEIFKIVKFRSRLKFNRMETY